MSMSRLRRYGFWTLDAIKGGKIRRHYLDIKSKLEDGKVDIDREHQHQIRSLIEHAKKYTQFYRDIKGDNLKDLPIVTKVDFKNNFDLFQSTTNPFIKCQPAVLLELPSQYIRT